MGSSSSRAADVSRCDEQTAPVSIPEEPCAAIVEESTHIPDMIQSGRYAVAKPQTIEFLRQTQSTPQIDRIAHPADAAKSFDDYIREQEGLDIGQNRKQMLSQQWRFYLGSEPVQRGLDCGLVLGSIAAVWRARKPANRVAHVIGPTWMAGFCVGMMAMPMFVVAMDLVNSQRIKHKEKELFTKQRQEFYEGAKK